MSANEKLSKEDVHQLLKNAIKYNRVSLSRHADERMKERNITWFEVLETLEKGWNERRKDQFDEKHNQWVYAIRYNLKVSTKEQRRLRIPVAFIDSSTIVVTTIDIDR